MEVKCEVNFWWRRWFGLLDHKSRETNEIGVLSFEFISLLRKIITPCLRACPDYYS